LAGAAKSNESATTMRISVPILLMRGPFSAAFNAAPCKVPGRKSHDRAGRVTGTARTDRNGVTTFRDAAGRTNIIVRSPRRQTKNLSQRDICHAQDQGLQESEGV
jgi:hypothetical protein